MKDALSDWMSRLVAANDGSDSKGDERMRVCLDIASRLPRPMTPEGLKSWYDEFCIALIEWAIEDGISVENAAVGNLPAGTSVHIILLSLLTRTIAWCLGEEGKRLVAEGVAECSKLMLYPDGLDAAHRTTASRIRGAIGDAILGDIAVIVLTEIINEQFKEELRAQIRAMGIDPDGPEVKA